MKTLAAICVGIITATALVAGVAQAADDAGTVTMRDYYRISSVQPVLQGLQPLDMSVITVDDIRTPEIEHIPATEVSDPNVTIADSFFFPPIARYSTGDLVRGSTTPSTDTLRYVAHFRDGSTGYYFIPVLIAPTPNFSTSELTVVWGTPVHVEGDIWEMPLSIDDPAGDVQQPTFDGDDGITVTEHDGLSATVRFSLSTLATAEFASVNVNFANHAPLDLPLLYRMNQHAVIFPTQTTPGVQAIDIPKALRDGGVPGAVIPPDSVLTIGGETATIGADTTIEVDIPTEDTTVVGKLTSPSVPGLSLAVKIPVDTPPLQSADTQLHYPDVEMDAQTTSVTVLPQLLRGAEPLYGSRAVTDWKVTTSEDAAFTPTIGTDGTLTITRTPKPWGGFQDSEAVTVSALLDDGTAVTTQFTVELAELWDYTTRAESRGCQSGSYRHMVTAILALGDLPTTVGETFTIPWPVVPNQPWTREDIAVHVGNPLDGWDIAATETGLTITKTAATASIAREDWEQADITVTYSQHGLVYDTVTVAVANGDTSAFEYNPGGYIFPDYSMAIPTVSPYASPIFAVPGTTAIVDDTADDGRCMFNDISSTIESMTFTDPAVTVGDVIDEHTPITVPEGTNNYIDLVFIDTFGTAFDVPSPASNTVFQRVYINPAPQRNDQPIPTSTATTTATSTAMTTVTAEPTPADEPGLQSNSEPSEDPTAGSSQTPTWVAALLGVGFAISAILGLLTKFAPQLLPF